MAGISLLDTSQTYTVTGALVDFPELCRCILILIIPDLRLLALSGLAARGFEAPMGDDVDDQIEWLGPNPIRAPGTSLRGIRNALLQVATSAVGRDDITVRVIDGLDQHAITDPKRNDPPEISNPDGFYPKVPN